MSRADVDSCIFPRAKLDKVIDGNYPQAAGSLNLTSTSIYDDDLQIDLNNCSVLSSTASSSIPSLFSSPLSPSFSNYSFSCPGKGLGKRARSISFDLDLKSRSWLIDNSQDIDVNSNYNSNVRSSWSSSSGSSSDLDSSDSIYSSILLNPMAVTGGLGIINTSLSGSSTSSTNSPFTTITRARTNSGPPRPSFIKTNLDSYGSDESSPITSSTSTASTLNEINPTTATTSTTTSNTTPSKKPHFVRHRDSFHSAGPIEPPGLSSALTNGNNQQLHHVHTSSINSKLSPVNHQFRKVRSKSFSEQVTETSQEAIRQLAPPISLPLVLTCVLWYGASAMSNTLNKSILTAFPYPVTLSMVQFTLAVCFGFSTLKLCQMSPDLGHKLPKGFISTSGIGFKPPTRAILMSTAPMGVFQLSGHILSHMSTSLIPVSLVHTIKALSPLFTVAAYRLLFGVSYKRSTYLSLLPLTLGVIMTCSVEFTSHFMGIMYALIATLIFVSQNMFSKKLLTSGNTGGDESVKLDKLNVLCYCSSLAFIFTFPLWFFSEGIGLLSDYSNSRGQYFGTESTSSDGLTSSTGLLLAFFTNGFVHFAQNLLAFQVLGMVSPVTYSVASLVKRIVVITVAILWFGQVVTGTQGWGILLTFLGLYLYDRCGGDKDKNYEPKSAILPK